VAIKLSSTQATIFRLGKFTYVMIYIVDAHVVASRSLNLKRGTWGLLKEHALKHDCWSRELKNLKIKTIIY
jgi:hypothetical protein